MNEHIVDEHAVETAVRLGSHEHEEGALSSIAAELVRRVEGMPLMQRIPARCAPEEQERLYELLRDLTSLRHGQAALSTIGDVSFDVLAEVWPELAALLSPLAHTHVGEWRVQDAEQAANGQHPLSLSSTLSETPPAPLLHGEGASNGAGTGALVAEVIGATPAGPSGEGQATPAVAAAVPLTAAGGATAAVPPPSGAASSGFMSARLLTTLAVGLAILIYALDLTVMSTAAPTIIAQFHDISLYGWLFAAYSIPVAATTLLYGRLGDVFGRKRLFTAAMLGFLLASMACALAANMAELIAFRAVQGLFAGAIFPCSVAIIASVYPIEQRARGFSIVPSAFAFASVLGPTAGGFLTQGPGWRWIFLLNVPVVLIAVTVLTLVYHEGAPTRRLALRDIDVTGALVFAGALVVVLVAVTIGGGTVAWLSWQESLLWTAGVALVVIFAWWERRVRVPLLPLRILRHRGLGGALLTIALLIWIVDSLLFFIPSLAQGVLGGTAASAGAILIPLMLTWSLTALVSLRLGQRYGFRSTALVGCLALAASLVTLGLVPSTAAQGALVLPMLLAGLGAGMINPNMMLLAQNSLSDRDQGLAGGLGGCIQVLVAAVVAPLLAALELGRLANHFGGSLPDTSRLLSVQGRHSLTVQYGAAYVHDLRLALGAALHDVFSAGFVALAVVILVLLLIVPTNAVARRIRLAPLGR